MDAGCKPNCELSDMPRAGAVPVLVPSPDAFLAVTVAARIALASHSTEPVDTLELASHYEDRVENTGSVCPSPEQAMLLTVVDAYPYARCPSGRCARQHTRGAMVGWGSGDRKSVV